MFRKKINNIIFPFLIFIFIFISCNNNSIDSNNTTNNVTIDNEIDSANYIITLIELGSVSCVPCKMMKPILAEIKEEYEGIVKVIFYDVWTENGKTYAEKYNVRVIPTQVFLDENGEEYHRHEGFYPKKEVIKIIEMKISN